MRAQGADLACARTDADPGMEPDAAALNLNSGYVMRAMDRMPKQVGGCGMAVEYENGDEKE